MTAALRDIIDRFADLHVLVVGEAMLDSYLNGQTRRLSQEAPVPVVNLKGRSDVPGGAGNVAVNVRSLGSQVSFLSVCGSDPEGEILAQSLQERGVGSEHLLIEPGRRTLTKHRLFADGQMLVRFDHGDTGPLPEETEERLLNRLIELWPACHAVIVSDYNYGVLSQRVISTLAMLQLHDPRVVVADSRRLAAYRHVGLTAVKPNYQEALELLGMPELAEGRSRADEMLLHGERLLELTGAHLAAVTLDTEGALFFDRGGAPYRTYARPVPNSKAAGAGDTFVSALTVAIAAGADAQAAAEIASASTAIVTAKEGTSTCFDHELREHFAVAAKYVPDLSRLSARSAFYREQGQRVVLTNGCFDILHRGHITFLNRAKALGDILIVGVNTDAGIQRLKGPTRPINTLEDRVQVLCALSSVDHVVAFDEDTPCELVRALRPKVFVKGGDYTRERLPEAEIVESLGGEVHILPYLADRSTTGIIERIRASSEASAQETA